MSILPEQSGIKEAYALAYAAFRLGADLNNAAFRQAFESRGLELLSAALDADPARQLKMVRDMEYLVGFGRDTGLIHPQTAEIMLGEIGKFNPANNQEAIPSGTASSQVKPIPARDLFPNHGNVGAADRLVQASTHAGSVSGKLPDISSESFNIRKNRIVERVRQSGNMSNPAIGCRLRDIQEVLPDLSERTLRYDLQRLVAEGAIERIGNGGPSTFYRIRQ